MVIGSKTYGPTGCNSHLVPGNATLYFVNPSASQHVCMWHIHYILAAFVNMHRYTVTYLPGCFEPKVYELVATYSYSMDLALTTHICWAWVKKWIVIVFIHHNGVILSTIFWVKVSFNFCLFWFRFRPVPHPQLSLYTATHSLSQVLWIEIWEDCYSLTVTITQGGGTHHKNPHHVKPTHYPLTLFCLTYHLTLSTVSGRLISSLPSDNRFD